MSDKSTQQRDGGTGARPISQREFEAYDRLMEVERRLERLRVQRGVSDATMAQALGEFGGVFAEGHVGPKDEYYLSRLERYVAALGGHLEVHAVLPAGRVELLRGPDGLPRP